MIDNLNRMVNAFAALVFIQSKRRAIARIRNRDKMKSADYMKPFESNWFHIKHHGSEAAWIDAIALNKSAFLELWSTMDPYMPASKPLGRKCRMEREDMLALTLYWLHTKVTIAKVGQFFGCPEDTTGRCMSKGLDVLDKHLASHPDAAIVWPNVSEIKQWAAAIKVKLLRCKQPFDLAEKPFAFVDGCDLRIQRSSQVEEHDLNYNKKNGFAKVGNIFVWSPTGKIIMAMMNAPGKMHDSDIAADLYKRLSDRTQTPSFFAILADQGFTAIDGSLICTLGPHTVCSIVVRSRSTQIARLRAASEWGNAGLKNAWARLDAKLSSDSAKRARLIKICALLYNFRTALIGRNEIRTAFSPDWSGNWRLARSQPSGQQQFVAKMVGQLGAAAPEYGYEVDDNDA